MMALAVFETIQ